MDRLRGFEVVTEFKDKNINPPVRKTKHSAGYDFESAEDVTIPSIWKSIIRNIGEFFTGENRFELIKPTLVKTGIKSYFQEDEVLMLFNRSSNPFKKGLILANSVGIIDHDFYNNPDNEGHMQFAFFNFFPMDVEIKKGDCIGQGIFNKFLKVDNDNADGERISGYGSTDETK